MRPKNKQQWTDEETQCFLALWSSSEVQNKLDGATRIKPVFEEIQREMAAAGYDRTLEQLLNKLKKAKKNYRDRKGQLGRSGRTKRMRHFDLLDSVLGDRSVNQSICVLNSATADTDSAVNQSNVQRAANNTELSMKEEADSELPLQPFICSLPIPSCSTSSSSNQTRSEKRKRDSTTELLEYLERSEERFLEQTRRDQDLTAALLQTIQRMNETSSTLVGLMESMVSVMEGLPQK